MADEASESQADKSPGQTPAVKADLRSMKRSLSWQNAGQVVLVIGAVWVGYKVVVSAVLNDAIAANPLVVQHGEAIREIKTEMREGLAEQRALSIRQLEEGRARDEWHETGRKPAILDAPLPVRDAGL